MQRNVQSGLGCCVFLGNGINIFQDIGSKKRISETRQVYVIQEGQYTLMRLAQIRRHGRFSAARSALKFEFGKYDWCGTAGARCNSKCMLEFQRIGPVA